MVIDIILFCCHRWILLGYTRHRLHVFNPDPCGGFLITWHFHPGFQIAGETIPYEPCQGFFRGRYYFLLFPFPHQMAVKKWIPAQRANSAEPTKSLEVQP